MSIYVGNLSYEVTQDHLKPVFEDYGKVTRVHFPTDRETGRARGFAFVEMSKDEEEDAAITALDGAGWVVFSKLIRLSLVKVTIRLAAAAVAVTVAAAAAVVAASSLAAAAVVVVAVVTKLVITEPIQR